MLSPLSFSVLLFSTRSTISFSAHRPLPGLCLCAKSQPDKRISQVVGAVTKALAVDDKKEAILVGATLIFVINHILNQFGWINYLEGHIMTLSAKVGSSVKKALKSMISQGNDSAVKITQVRLWYWWWFHFIGSLTSQVVYMILYDSHKHWLLLHRLTPLPKALAASRWSKQPSISLSHHTLPSPQSQNHDRGFKIYTWKSSQFLNRFTCSYTTNKHHDL